MTPLVYVAAAPKAPARVRTLTREQGVRQLLEQPPYTRHDGWNLVTLDRARLVTGQRLSLSNGERKHIDLYADGSFVAVGAIPGFLAWHRRDIPNKLNSLALIEFVYNSLLVYERIVLELEPLPDEIRLALGLRHAHEFENPIYIAYGRIDRFDYEADLDVRRAPEDAFHHEVDIALGEAEPHFDIGAAAHSLLVRLYNWFEFPDEALPYTNEDRTAIDIDEIVAR